MFGSTSGSIWNCNNNFLASNNTLSNKIDGNFFGQSAGVCFSFLVFLGDVNNLKRENAQSVMLNIDPIELDEKSVVGHNVNSRFVYTLLIL